jgi:hypothetical protein
MGLIFCINIALIPISEASHSTSKAFAKFSKAKIGAKHNLSSNMLKALSYSSSHLNPIYFLTNSVKGDAILLKSFINRP